MSNLIIKNCSTFIIFLLVGCAPSSNINIKDAQKKDIETEFESNIKIRLKSAGIPEIKNLNFIKGIEETCTNNQLLEASCLYNKIDITKNYSEFERQHSTLYSDNNTVITSTVEVDEVETDELGIQPVYKKTISILKNQKVTDTLEIYKNESLYYFVGTEKLFYIDDSFDLWLLESDILEEKIIIKKWEKYNIDITKGKFIKDNSVYYHSTSIPQ